LHTSVWVVYLAGQQIAFDVMLQTHNTTNISSETVVYDSKLPFRIRIPLDVTRSPQFKIAHTYIALTGSIITLKLMAIEIFSVSTFIYLTDQLKLLYDSIRNASEKVKYRIDKRQHSSAGSNGITKRRVFTSDKKTKIQYSRGDTESVSSTKGKGNIIYATHQSSLKHASVYIFSSDFLRTFLLA
jgi:hypothetical protein